MLLMGLGVLAVVSAGGDGAKATDNTERTDDDVRIGDVDGGPDNEDDSDAAVSGDNADLDDSDQESDENGDDADGDDADREHPKSSQANPGDDDDSPPSSGNDEPSGDGTGGGSEGEGGQQPTTSPLKPQYIQYEGWKKPVRGNFREPIGATVDSGLPIKYVLVPGSSKYCQLDGSYLVVDPWHGFDEVPFRYNSKWFPVSCRVRASQAGGNGYSPAAAIERTLVIDFATVALQVREQRSSNGFALTVSDPAHLATEVKVWERSPTTCEIVEFRDGPVGDVKLSVDNGFTQVFHVVPLDGGDHCTIDFQSFGELTDYAFQDQYTGWSGSF
jgi:hypothetical protein